MANLFEWDSTIPAMTLLGHLFTIHLEAKSMMQSFLMRVKVIHNQLLAMESSLTSTKLAIALVLTKLLDEYNMVAKVL